ncbi:transglycosylase SLT domain-containing protein [Pelotomaculum schinkii]|uniref:transglycosylase SLT domain-containing protein n=1 Tax=Pelotomaculum schinkii TaxID=78350 RepID=UPI001FAA49EE|nr:transglycosylase SLT domain-containing protein [Pelotomaculum schinkii]
MYTDSPNMLPTGHYLASDVSDADVVVAFTPEFLKGAVIRDKLVLLAGRRAPLSLAGRGLEIKLVDPANLSDVLTCLAIRRSVIKEKTKQTKKTGLRSIIPRKKQACALLVASLAVILAPGLSIAANEPVSLLTKAQETGDGQKLQYARFSVPDKNGKPVWPTSQEKVIVQYGFDGECNYHAAATLAANTGEPIRAALGGVIKAIYGDSVTVDGYGMELTYGNLMPAVALNDEVCGDATLGTAKGNITLVAKRGGMLFDPVASFWPELSRFAAQKKEQEQMAVQIKAVEEKAGRMEHIPIRPPENMEQTFENAAKVYGVDVDLLKAVASEESGFDSMATSSKGAMGVMQLMPGTAAEQGVTSPYDVAQNIYGGARYLKEQLLRFNGDVACALAAYNAGPKAVLNCKGVPPYVENYVRAVIAEYNGLNEGVKL